MPGQASAAFYPSWHRDLVVRIMDPRDARLTGLNFQLEKAGTFIGLSGRSGRSASVALPMMSAGEIDGPRPGFERPHCGFRLYAL